MITSGQTYHTPTGSEDPFVRVVDRDENEPRPGTWWRVCSPTFGRVALVEERELSIWKLVEGELPPVVEAALSAQAERLARKRPASLVERLRHEERALLVGHLRYLSTLADSKALPEDVRKEIAGIVTYIEATKNLVGRATNEIERLQALLDERRANGYGTEGLPALKALLREPPRGPTTIYGPMYIVRPSLLEWCEAEIVRLRKTLGAVVSEQLPALVAVILRKGDGATLRIRKRPTRGDGAVERAKRASWQVTFCGRYEEDEDLVVAFKKAVEGVGR